MIISIKRDWVRKRMKLDFLTILNNPFKIFHKEFLEGISYISSSLPKVNRGLELVPCAHFSHIFSMKIFHIIMLCQLTTFQYYTVLYLPY